ncbi:hypothetical protein Bca52824_093705 [Brassica carinata]|uniref:Glutathione S-transferase C-terminal domain-containing protein n=1 Tax=Brassica carinata TaxID=52824 RepID=A0A8X7P591_BRACI|nr:hypothetical protein Bca52824_093705 [Brassica carinata]
MVGDAAKKSTVSNHILTSKSYTFPSDSPPLSVIVALSLSSSPVIIDSSSSPAATTVPTFLFSHGYFPFPLRLMITFFLFSSGSEFENACTRVDKYLESANFLVGHSLSIADVAIWSALTGSGLRWECLRKSKKYQNLVRWFNSILLDYAEPLNKVAAYTTTMKEGSGKPVALAAAPRTKDQERASKPVR